MKILGLDPGTQNFAYSVLEIKARNGRAYPTVLEAGQYKDTNLQLRKDSDINAQITVFKEQIAQHMDSILYDDCRVIVERFQTRGWRGSGIEAIGIMIGCILFLTASLKIPVRVVTASSWKNRVGKETMKELYGIGKAMSVTPHEIDASMMALLLGAEELRVEADLGITKIRKFVGGIQDARSKR